MEPGPTDELVAELLIRAQRTAARIVGRDGAEDVASEAVIRALVRWGRVSDYPHAWVTKVATNLAIDVLRSRRQRPADLHVQSQRSFEGDTVGRLDVIRGLRLLPRRQRQVVVLHYLEGFTDGEVSEVLGLSLPTVKTHLGRALITLRRMDGAVREENDASTGPA